MTILAPFFALIFIAAVAICMALYKKPIRKIELPDGYKHLLEKHVAFYRSLDDAGKMRFEEKIKEFLLLFAPFDFYCSNNTKDR